MNNPLARLALLAALALPQLALAASPQDDPPAPKTGTVELYVMDEDGEGIFKAYAMLVLTEEERAKKMAESKTGGFLIENVTTDPDGFATLTVPAGERRTIRVDKRRDAKSVEVEIEPLAPGETREIEVTLITKPDLDVKAQVVDAVTREPVEGVAVHLSTRDMGTFGGRPEPLDVDETPDAVTGEDGTFELRVRSWRRGHVTLVAPGRSPLLATLAPNGEPRPLEPPLAMKRSGSLRGTIRSEIGDVPKGTTVVLEVQGYNLGQNDGVVGFTSFKDAIFVAPVDHDGTYRFVDLPSGVPVALRVENRRDVLLRESAERRLAAGEDTVADLLLGAGKRVHGIVIEADGEAAADVEVWLRRSTGRGPGLMDSYPEADAITRTGPDGLFAFDDVEAGKWEVGLAPSRSQRRLPDDQRYAPMSQVVEVRGEDVAVDLVLHRGVYIEGTVETPEGEPFTRRGVSVSARSGSMWVGNIQAKDGAFRCGPLLPGEWTLTARCWGRNDEDRTLAPPAAVVAETEGEPVVLRLTPGCGMRVRARDAQSGEVVDANYSLYGTETAKSQQSGGAREVTELWNLEPDRYIVAMRTVDGRFGFGTFELAAGDLLDDEVIDVAPGGTAVVAYQGPSMFARVTLLVDGTKAGFDTVPSGGTVTMVGPAGRVTIEVEPNVSKGDENAKTKATREIELTAGSTTRVDVKIE